MKYVLAIETSCDDTSVALVGEDRSVLCCLVASQDLVHKPFGGVVPEIASRNHTATLLPLVSETMERGQLDWSQILGVAVTNRPGLVGALIVGLVAGKTLALVKGVPFLGVHHIEGHVMAPFLIDDQYQGPDFFEEDFLALVVSGGHTQIYRVRGFGNYEVLGETIDDAAGEAFDKFAKMMGLDYPGGVHVDRLAKRGDPKAFDFPRPMIREEGFNLSFSGLKSAAQRLLAEMNPQELESRQSDLCASYQQAIVDLLGSRMEKALQETELKKMVVSGGVSANSSLRQRMEELTDHYNCELALPPLRFCTDNAAMIGLAGLFRLQKGESSPQSLAPQPRASL